jgi:hypothetical protein
MTAATLITNLQDTTLVGLKIGDKAVGDNTTLLLSLLNMAKDKIAEDTLLWLNGETFNMVDGTSLYTLTNMPIQIIDVFDSNNYLRPRNSAEYFGYYQTSPNQLTFNNIADGLTIKVNYYYSPPDYLIGDTLAVPSTLLSAMQYYMAHKAYAAYKGELELMASGEYYNKYVNAIKDYRATTDTLDADSVVSNENKIWLRGIR